MRETLTGRIGARFARTWTFTESQYPRTVTGWLRASLWNEFLGTPKVEFSSDEGFIPFRSDLGGPWAEFKAGISAQLDRHIQAFGSIGASVGLDGRSHAYDGKLGIRVTW